VASAEGLGAGVVGALGVLAVGDGAGVGVVDARAGVLGSAPAGANSIRDVVGERFAVSLCVWGFARRAWTGFDVVVLAAVVGAAEEVVGAGGVATARVAVGARWCAAFVLT
jgi:hypothetical protein